MIKPLVNDTYEERMLTDVVLDKKGGIELEQGAICFYIPKERNPMNILPKIGDVALFYGKGFGYQVRGVQVNDKLIYYETPEEQERKHQHWVTETRENYRKEYLELMEKIKDEESFKTVDVTGMGGGYERMAQLMIQSGYKWLQENDFHFDYYTFEGVYGLCVSDAPWSKKLDDVLMKACNDDCTGAMHQCVITHLQHIYKHGYSKWLSKFPEERRYIYPKELPPPSF